jgi:hypothetical protein
MRNDDEPDLFAALAARDEALERVLENSGPWRHEALAAVGALPPGWTGTGEDIRRATTGAGLPAPHHHNAWGGITNAAKRAGLIEPLHVWRPMTGERSHARQTQVWKRV